MSMPKQMQRTIAPEMAGYPAYTPYTHAPLVSRARYNLLAAAYNELVDDLDQLQRELDYYRVRDKV